MAEPRPSSVRPTPAEVAGSPLAIKPLTRRGYKRLAATERQISEASTLDVKALLARAQQKETAVPDYLSPEALVYFIRRADRASEIKVRDDLFRELLERCTPFFRGKFRGFDRTVTEDLRGDVLSKVVEDLLAPDDRADFMEVRFWSYLERRTIDACRTAFRHADETESLDAGYVSEGESEGRAKRESHADRRLSPEQLATVAEGLAKLPASLRKAFWLRHGVGMAIGSDDPADDPPDKLTLAREFGCSGRTIRNWLKQAEELLTDFREK